MWEQHCDKKVQEIGFKPIGEEWPSMCFHDELKLLLVIYVDDLKLAGPSENLAKGWEMLRTVLRIEPETDLGLYLGCVLSQGETQLHNGKKVKTITYNMEGLLKLSVEKYLDIIGKDTKLKKVSTPSLPEETKCSPYRAPFDGKRKVECPWCAHSFDPEMSALNETVNSRPGQDSETLNRGNLAPHAASVLMKLLYAARIARFDLLRSINALARNVTKWTKDDDARLHHLMCYVNSTLSLKMIGWVGDKIEDLSLGLFADADFAGCAQSLRSTSGSHLQVQGKFTRFPLAGGSKRQGCVSHSTPEAEIVAADTALRTLGIPALSLWKVLAKVFPQLLFHDDNQGMIGVVRSGRNPTMRHLERTHGISIASMHEHFQKDHFVLIYEITAKMAADIHTKGFRNPMAWKKACMLINLLEPQDLQSKEVLDMLQPSTDVDMTTRQVFQSKTEDIPNFPYTETPILPKEVYKKGLTSKEKLQYLPGMDPIFVVKQPVFYRPKPPGLMVPPDVLRSTWILLNGTWTKVEHRASPPEQAVRFDKWVERACFQYHSPNKQPLIPETVPQSTSTTSTQRVSSSTYAHAQTAHSSSHRDSGVSTRNSRVKHPADSPMLMFSVDALFLDAQTSPSQHPKPIHQCLQPATRESQGLSKKNENYWQWEGEETLIRIHKTPRRQNFVPQDCEDCPCDHRIICDERETEQKFKTNTRVIKDTWRFKGDNNETTNKLNEFWTGRSTFKVLANAEVIDSDKSYKVSQGVITLCTHCSELNTIPITDVFVPYQYHIEVSKHEVDHPKVSVILWRDHKKRTLEFQLSKSPCDLMTSKFAKFSLAINLIEVPRDVPCFVLLCSEERNWFTFLQNKMQDEMKFHVVPITEDDDMLSPYGICKARRCLRTKLDSVFFAGPCTGGSPWNRINRWVSEATTQLIEAKKQIFWAMWEVFTSVLCELINMGSPALLELPRGCDYWKDRRMTDLVEGTVSHEHKFDGCMYGLKSQFQETPKPIKKPWKIVTWGVSFPKLRRKCDRRHDHAECAGRETRITQVYTKWIAKIIMKGINEHVIKNSPFVNVKVRKHWKIITPDDDWLSEMSRDSENVRSHPIKLVTTTACAIRGPDAIDLLFERSLLHWYLSRSTSLLTRSSWSSTFLWHLLSGFNDNLLFRDQRSVQLLELIGTLSHCYLSIQTEPLKITMTEGVDLKSLGQFSNKRITIAQRILKETHERVITARPPPPFRDTRNTGPRLLSSEDVVNQWIRFGMPPVIVYSAYFANTRYNEATGEALELAYKILQRSLDSEKECLGWEFVSRGSRFVKVFASKCPCEDDMVGLLMDEDIHSRLDELWIVLTKGHFPEPFDDTHSAAFAEAKIRDMKQLYRGTPSFNTEPSATSWLAVTRTAEYFKVMDELAKVNPRSPSDNENYFATMRQMVETHIKLLGFSLRYHNQHNPQDLIILQDVTRDVVDFETERPKGRSAAQNHFLCLLTLGSTIERHKNCARGDGNFARLAAWTEIQTSILISFDIPQRILIGLGYNVTIADEGARYSEKERRHACHSQLKDFITTMTETQAGTGGNLHNFDGWDEPLRINDGRLPDELDAWNNEEPSWAQDDPTGGSSAPGGTTSQGGSQAQPTATPGSSVQPKRMPRPSTSGGATSSSQSAFRTGPGPTPSNEQKETEEEDKDKTPNVDWVKRKKPSNVKTYIYAAEDYAHQEQRIAFLRSGKEFVISTVEGPHSTHIYGSLWIEFGMETVSETLDFPCSTFLQHPDWRTIGCPDAQWERPRMAEALPLSHYDYWTCQMQRISSDGSLGNADTRYSRYSGRRPPQETQGPEQPDWSICHGKTMDWVMGWTGRASEDEQMSYPDWFDVSDEVNLKDHSWHWSRSQQHGRGLHQGLPAPLRIPWRHRSILADCQRCVEFPSQQCRHTHQHHRTCLDLFRITVQRTESNFGPWGWLCQKFDWNYWGNQSILTHSNLCQHLEGRPILWIPIIDCFHRWGVRRDLEEQRHHAFHSRKILETDLCVWIWTFLLETRWWQRNRLGHFREILDATKGFPSLCNGSLYGPWIEWRMCSCEEYGLWPRNDQKMHWSPRGHPEPPQQRDSWCTNWICWHHWRNEAHEGLRSEKGMDGHSTGRIHPRTFDWRRWTLDWSDRTFRSDVRYLQKPHLWWPSYGHYHWESHKLSELREQLDKNWNLWHWSPWYGRILARCSGRRQTPQCLQQLHWLERTSCRTRFDEILAGSHTCDAFWVQDIKRRPEASISSRCDPHACIHGERQMQTTPTVPIHSPTWDTMWGRGRWYPHNPMVLQIALGWRKRGIPWLHENSVDQRGDWIDSASQCLCRIHWWHLWVLAWNAWDGNSIPHNVQRVGEEHR